MWQWLADLLAGRTRPQRAGQEPDVEPDPAQVDPRPATDEFVGRVAADESGDERVSGAEARSEQAGDPRLNG
jgi:hypothetical protein